MLSARLDLDAGVGAVRELIVWQVGRELETCIERGKGGEKQQVCSQFVW